MMWRNTYETTILSTIPWSSTDSICIVSFNEWLSTDLPRVMLWILRDFHFTMDSFCGEFAYKDNKIMQNAVIISACYKAQASVFKLCTVRLLAGWLRIRQAFTFWCLQGRSISTSSFKSCISIGWPLQLLSIRLDALVSDYKQSEHFIRT